MKSVWSLRRESRTLRVMLRLWFPQALSETWLGEWMAARNNRDQFVLATKFTSDYRSHALGRVMLRLWFPQALTVLPLPSAWLR
jgi:hypothetical protein